MERIELNELFKSMQEEMISSLSLGRSHITHKGEMGEASENSWIGWLSKYLPRRYKIDKAFVVDCDGNISDQIDIVIYDTQYSYFVFKHEQVTYVPAESVYAVIEVKQELNKVNLDYAAKKAESVRRLRRTSVEIPFAAGKYRPKPLHHILAGIITLDSSWKDPLGTSLRNNIRNLETESRIDFGCALNNGSFWADYSPRFALIKSVPEESLMFLFLQLLMHLQSIGTVPAINISEYAKTLRSFRLE